MLQTVAERIENRVEVMRLPPPKEHVMPGVQWGLSHAPFTPAYWAAQWWYARGQCNYADYKRGTTLQEEVVACLLGGHGITAEMNDAAYARLHSLGLLAVPSPLEIISEALNKPLTVQGRQLRYRFPRQKARFVHAALKRLACEPAPTGDLAFRDWLLKFPGIGPKTASWITRNWLSSNRVAIIDIHVFRAATIAGIFRGDETIHREYKCLEDRFLSFAKAVDIEACQLDVMMWRQMKDAGKLAIDCFVRALAKRSRFLLT